MSEIDKTKLSAIKTLPVTSLGADTVRVQLAVKTGPADNDETSRLVVLAKGPNRSIRVFANEIGVNVSSLSRIINGQVRGISAPLLAKIAFHADPQSGVTLDQLMAAQGLSDPQDGIMSEKEYGNKCRRILVDELIQSGYMVKKLELEPIHNNSITRFDFVFYTDALKNGTGLWAVEYKFSNPYNHTGTGIIQSTINQAMSYFYMGNTDIQRVSLVVDRRVIFEQISNELRGLKLPNEISVILVNTHKGSIVEEFVAPLTGAGDPDSVFNTRQE